ncbi:MAG: ABC transporter ATP-binding protein, partial [Desulfobacterales bacterium]|nr:ABC transporter ATP-binding protein [Desulfobacterales bacterium]
MLELKNINTYYGEFHAIRDVSFKVDERDFFLVVGPNGHGKSTLLKTICGLLRTASGQIVFDATEITRSTTDKIVEMGLVYVAEERHLFPQMTVLDNLKLGAYNTNARAKERESLEYVFHLFPRLNEFKSRYAATLSGGEARMLTLGRGIMSRAKLLAIDEPSFGLAPILRNEVFEKINEINATGMTVLLVEQNVNQVVDFADRVCVIEDGCIVFE